MQNQLFQANYNAILLLLNFFMSSDSVIDRLLHRLKSNPDVKKQESELRNTYLEKPSHTFVTYPFYLWIPGGVLFMVGTLLLVLSYLRDKYSILLIISTILTFYISAYILYTAKVEFITVSRSEQYVKHEIRNIFCKKVSRKYNFSQIKLIMIVKKGQEDSYTVTSRFYTRLYLTDDIKDGNSKRIDFGKTFSFEKAYDKFLICNAMIKGNCEIPKQKYVVDETIYKDYLYKKSD